MGKKISHSYVGLVKNLATYSSIVVIILSICTPLLNSQQVLAQESLNNQPGFTVTATSLTGRVTNPSQQPLADIWVTALRTSDYYMVAGSATNQAGDYSLNLPDGDYMLYVVDKTGVYKSGFYGGNSPQIVSIGATQSNSPMIVLERAKATVHGQIKSSNNTPISNAWAMILSANSQNPGEPVAVVTADANGYYQSPQLPAGNYTVGWIDPSGNHSPIYHPSVQSPQMSTPITLAVGQDLELDGTMPSQTSVSTESSLSGQVLNAQSQPLSGVRVVALNGNNYSFARGTTTDANGNYQLQLPSGDYILAYVDQAGNYIAEWSGNVALNNIAAAQSVSTPSTTTTSLAAANGEAKGVISDDQTQSPLSGVWVMVMQNSTPVAGATTNAQGEYQLSGLAAGQYQLMVVDPLRQRVTADPNNVVATINIQIGETTITNANLNFTTITTERRGGQPLEEFPFTIMTEPPHRVHNPVTDFGSVTVNADGSYVFYSPTITSDDGLYGRFWLSPEPPTPGALLTGVRIKQASWQGVSQNTISVFSLLDRAVENNATGTVTGATQGLPNELAAVIFEPYSEMIELRLTTPTSNSTNRFVFAIDTENIPMGYTETIYPTSISVGQIEWMWQLPQ